MLVLLRRKGETIVIGDKVRITVMKVKGKQARLGVSAPEEVVVKREEAHHSSDPYTCGIKHT